MKKLTLFYMRGCPYCRNAEKAIAELISGDPQYADVEIERIDETARPDIAYRYDYYYVPSIFADGRKLYESRPFERYSECLKHVRAAFDHALGGG